jgi:hypothetical protein
MVVQVYRGADKRQVAEGLRKVAELVSVGQDTTTLRVGRPDPAALRGIVERMMGLRLKLIELRLVAVPSAASGDGSVSQRSPVG